MAIILRTVKGSALTHTELDANFTDITSSMVHSGSISGTTLTLHRSSSNFDIDLSGLDTTVATGSLLVTGSVSNNILTFTKGDGSTFNLTVDTGSGGGDNLYDADGTLGGNRTVTADSNNLTFDMSTATFQITTDSTQRVIFSGLGTGNNPQVLGIDPSTGAIKAMNTSSIAGGGSATPQGSDSQVQYNNGGSFGGATLYFDDANNRLGIGETTPARPLHITDSNAVAVRLENTASINVGIQYFGSGSAGTGTITRGTGNNFEILQYDSDIVGNLFLSASGEIYAPRLASASKANIVGYDSVTGELSYFSTASFGGGTPGGSDGQVQYNNGGAFGGESTFTYDDTNNVLSIQGVTNGPAIKLSNATPGLSDGSEIAELVARSSIYSADIAGIIFKGDGATGGGDYPTRIEFTTTPDGTAVPTTKFQIKNDGKLIANEYGSGTFTGTAAKWLAVDSSGNVIEENTPVATSSNILTSGSYSVNATSTTLYGLADDAMSLSITKTDDSDSTLALQGGTGTLGTNKSGIIVVKANISCSGLGGVQLQYLAPGGSETNISGVAQSSGNWILVFAYYGSTRLHLISSQSF